MCHCIIFNHSYCGPAVFPVPVLTRLGCPCGLVRAGAVRRGPAPMLERSSSLDSAPTISLTVPPGKRKNINQTTIRGSNLTKP